MQIKPKRMFFFFCLAFRTGWHRGKQRKGGWEVQRKKNLLADTVIREINKEDSLHKPWAPVFQMIVAVTVFLVSGTNAHTHTPTSQDEHFPYLGRAHPTLPGAHAHSSPISAQALHNRHRHSSLLSLFFFSFLSFFHSCVCARTDQALKQVMKHLPLSRLTVFVCVPVVS